MIDAFFPSLPGYDTSFSFRQTMHQQLWGSPLASNSRSKSTQRSLVTGLRSRSTLGSSEPVTFVELPQRYKHQFSADILRQIGSLTEGSLAGLRSMDG